MTTPEPEFTPVHVERRRPTHEHIGIEGLNADAPVLRAHMEAEHTPGSQTAEVYANASDEVLGILHVAIHAIWTHRETRP